MDLQLPVQSVPITTKVISLNPIHGEVYSIQHYVIKFVSDLRQICGFLSTPVSFTNETDRHVISEILLKVALNTINLNLGSMSLLYIVNDQLIFKLLGESLNNDGQQFHQY